MRDFTEFDSDDDSTLDVGDEQIDASFESTTTTETTETAEETAAKEAEAYLRVKRFVEVGGADHDVSTS